MMQQNCLAKPNAKATSVFLVKEGSFLFSQENCTNKTLCKQLKDKELSGLQPNEGNEFYFGVSEEKGLDRLDELRINAFKLGKELKTRKVAKSQIHLDDATSEEILAISAGLSYADYEFNKYKTSAKKPAAQTISLIVSGSLANAKKAVNAQLETFKAVKIARDLVNEPGGSLEPADFVAVAKKCAAEYGFKIKVRTHTQLKKEGYMGLITVGKGSKNTPYMVTLEYSPARAAKGVNLGIVGKGMTFDSGGISLKPANGMWEMRCDMGGAAATLGGICAIAAAKVPVKVTAVLCIAENRPGEEAVLPGDIFTAKNGKTVMVDNTDAEGRLILSDGLAEAGAKKATHIVDIATLTGAIVRALGTSLTGLFSNDEEFAESIVHSGMKVGEKFWPMPLEMEYRSSIDDKVADLKNVGGDAGAVTAALFLNEFVPEGAKWAHWDIAGTAFHSSAWKYVDFGATGWGVQSLLELAKSFAVKK